MTTNIAESRPWSGGPRDISESVTVRPHFSICTLVTDRRQYDAMVTSFVDGGFARHDCEYLYIDNTIGNHFDAYTGYNTFLVEATGDFIVLCHQDVELMEDGRDRLESLLAELTRTDPTWGVCGNSGGIRPGRVATRISDPHGENQSVGTFPARVIALDENFMVVRRAANLAVSADLSGFHHYGADICIVADILGYSCWVIDFHLRHRSAGFQGPDYWASRRQIVRKWSGALRSRWIVTSCSSYLISNNRLSSSRPGRAMAKAAYRLGVIRKHSRPS